MHCFLSLLHSFLVPTIHHSHHRSLLKPYQRLNEWRHRHLITLVILIWGTLIVSGGTSRWVNFLRIEMWHMPKATISMFDYCWTGGWWRRSKSSITTAFQVTHEPSVVGTVFASNLGVAGLSPAEYWWGCNKAEVFVCLFKVCPQIFRDLKETGLSPNTPQDGRLEGGGES